MTFRVLRLDATAHRTIGVLLVDHHFLCYTLEDPLRPSGIKILGDTAIPPGKYLLQITMSQRFGRLMPILLDVPGFDGIRLHGGNTEADTKGCVLVGMTRSVDAIATCQPALDLVLRTLEAGLRLAPVWCRVENVL